MNKLYLLGALALSNVEAYLGFAVTPAIVAPLINPLRLAYTYTASTDCFTSQPATTLDPLSNIYYQYYSFTAAKGAYTFGTSPAPNIAHAYTGCTHSHLYNWMGTPRFTANA